ncbi:MAG TPA: hypothetical protein VGC85_05395 [Chthoniobacterales bacterium]
MQVANPIHRRDAVSRKRVKRAAATAASPEAIAEINAYIAIRDQLFAEAEELRTSAKLDSVTVANDFVANAVRPVRSPYDAQSLRAQDAAREMSRCEFVRGRIAQLRMLARVAA